MPFVFGTWEFQGRVIGALADGRKILFGRESPEIDGTDSGAQVEDLFAVDKDQGKTVEAIFDRQ